MLNRVVVTGIGAITPIGIGKDDFWKALVEGKSGVSKIEKFDVSEYPVKIAGQVKGFDPNDFIDKREHKRMDRFTQFAVAAAKLAFEDAGLDKTKYDETKAGVILGSGIGGIETIEEQHKRLLKKGPKRISPFFIPMLISNMAAGQISMLLNAKGPNFTVVTACASGTNAVGEAFKTIQRGAADIIITGGTEASITPLAVAGFSSMRALSTRNDEPEKASRPFDADRDGFVMGEGSGILILESLEHAVKRNAKIYAEIVGYGLSADAYHLTQPDPDGEGAALAMKLALEDGGIQPEEIDYINAHGTSTPYNDRFETLAIRKVFGSHSDRLMVSSIKSMTGHLLGAAGGVEAAATVLAIYHGIVPPTINYEKQDPDCDLDYVPNKAREASVKAALSNSFGFGGHNSTLAFKEIKD